MTAPQGPPAGWYPHPTMVDTQGYWDGTQWTEQVAPAGAVVAGPRPKDPQSTMLWLGWITAVLLPPAGLVMSVLLMTKGRYGHGVGMMALSAVFSLWLTAAIVY